MPIALTDKNIKPQLRLYLVLVIIEFLLQSINPRSTWHERLFSLMQKHGQVSKAHMGVPDDWDNDPFWRLAVTP